MTRTYPFIAVLAVAVLAGVSGVAAAVAPVEPVECVPLSETDCADDHAADAERDAERSDPPPVVPGTFTYTGDEEPEVVEGQGSPHPRHTKRPWTDTNGHIETDTNTDEGKLYEDITTGKNGWANVAGICDMGGNTTTCKTAAEEFNKIYCATAFCPEDPNKDN